MDIVYNLEQFYILILNMQTVFFRLGAEVKCLASDTLFQILNLDRRRKR